MSEFLRECFLTVNLPVTLLLLLVLVYWMMVIVGVLGTDILDFDTDVDLDGDADMDGDFHGDGILGTLFEFFYIGEVPLVIIGSFFVVLMWIVTMFSNHYLNDQHSSIVMLLWIVPNIIISLLATRFAMMPFATLFKNYDKTEFTHDALIGKIGIVKTSEVTDRFGQIEIHQDGPPLVLNVRTLPGQKLGPGDAAKILGFNPDNDTFLVELSKWEKT